MRRTLPHGCYGRRAATRRGVLTGTFRVGFEPTAFGTLHRARLRAVLARPGYACKPPSLPDDFDARRPIQLFETGPDAHFAFDRAHGTVFEWYGAGRRTAETTLLTRATVIAPATDLTADMAAGTATVDGAPPFFRGTATFTPAPGQVFDPGSAEWLGSLTGDLEVVLAGQAPARVGTAAELFQACGCL